jgi:ribosome maturation factor RimP
MVNELKNIENNVPDMILNMAEPMLTAKGMELVDVEYRKEGIGKVLRLFIDKPSGVSVEDCADISRELSTLIDINGVIDERYVLEVSSPGLRRPLKKLEDFKRFEGNLVLIKTKELIENRKVFKGYLKYSNDDGIEMDIDGNIYSLSFSQINKANLEIDF